MPNIVTDTETIRISEYDQTQLRNLEINSINAIQEDGSSTRQVLWDLERAFRLGFTAVGRGEADGQEHPPLPDFMSEGYDEADEVAAPVETVDESSALLQQLAQVERGVIEVFPEAHVVEIGGKFYVYEEPFSEAYMGYGDSALEAWTEALSHAQATTEQIAHGAARQAYYDQLAKQYPTGGHHRAIAEMNRAKLQAGKVTA